MSGRRRGTALAGAIDLASQLLLKRQEEERARRHRSEEMAWKFQQESALQREKFVLEGKGGFDPQTGQWVPRATTVPETTYGGLPLYEATDPVSGAKYRNPTALGDVPIIQLTGQGPQQIGTAPRGSKIIPQSVDERRSGFEAKNALNLIEQVYQKADELVPPTGGGPLAVVGGLARLAGGAVGLDENARAFEQYKEGTLSLTIRGLGERGVLTDQDVARARKLLPNLTDSAVVRKTKQAALTELLRSRLGSSGMPDLSGSEDDADIAALESQGYRVLEELP